MGATITNCKYCFRKEDEFENESSLNKDEFNYRNSVKGKENVKNAKSHNIFSNSYTKNETQNIINTESKIKFDLSSLKFIRSVFKNNCAKKIQKMVRNKIARKNEIRGFLSTIKEEKSEGNKRKDKDLDIDKNKSNKSYYFMHKKTRETRNSKSRVLYDEKERPINTGKFDMISNKDSINEEKKYFKTKDLKILKTVGSNKDDNIKMPLNLDFNINLDGVNIENSKIDGIYCLLKYPNNVYYYGQYSEQKGQFIPDDIGTITNDKKDRFIGLFDLGIVKGYGEYSNYNGKFNGLFNNNKFIIGQEIYKDGSFSGVYLNGEKSLGKFILNDGSYYEGEFFENSFNGFVNFLIKGSMHFNDGRIYSGKWLHGVLNGYCEMILKEGKIYFGFVLKDKKEGFGIFYTPSPKKYYLGFWKNNKQEGVGKQITEKTVKYGFWNQGEKLNFYDSYEIAINSLSTSQQEFKEHLKMEFIDLEKKIAEINNS